MVSGVTSVSLARLRPVAKNSSAVGISGTGPGCVGVAGAFLWHDLPFDFFFRVMVAWSLQVVRKLRLCVDGGDELEET
jgi:hypothetical protein